MKEIYNVEISSICQNKCDYCPHKELVRGKREQNMGYKVWRQCLYWLERFHQDTVCLNGFGEPLVHPRLIEWVKELNEIGISPYFSTNGILFTPEIAHELKGRVDYISISPHEEKAIGVINDIITNASILPKRGFPFVYGDKYPVPISVSDGFRRMPHTWAGQNGDLVNPNFGWPCEFIPQEKCTILSDGTVVACCIDAGGVSAMGNIMDINLETLKSNRFSLCEKCHQNGGVV
jgi:hypothetical protein